MPFDWNQYAKDYRKQNPEKARQWRINSYISALRKLGYIVIDPSDLPVINEKKDNKVGESNG